MSIKVNGIDKEKKHNISEYCAFVDTDGDFYLIDEDCQYISHITFSGCVIYYVESLDTIEEFLNCQYGSHCKVLKAYKHGDDYEIIVNG